MCETLPSTVFFLRIKAICSQANQLKTQPGSALILSKAKLNLA